jgi:hypothetical protein
VKTSQVRQESLGRPGRRIPGSIMRLVRAELAAVAAAARGERVVRLFLLAAARKPEPRRALARGPVRVD